MSRRLEDLDAEYRSLFNKLIEEIIISGVTPLIVFTYRPPVEQAVLWRQSRPEWLVNLTIARLSKGNLLQRKQAEALIKAGPCKGPHVTDALPYESAHQFGYAIDLCPLVDGKADWKNIELFKKMGKIGTNLGLVWGGTWKAKDYGHFEVPDWKKKALKKLIIA